MTRWAIIVTAVVAVSVGAFVAGRNWLLADRADPVPTDEIIDRYRAVVTSPAPPTTTATTPTDASSPATSTVATTAPLVSALPPAHEAPWPTDAADAPAALQLPEPGVYRYATDGWEEIDALGGTRHDYPAETTITVTPDGCGARLRWDALRERREEWMLCITAAGIELQPAGVHYHEFYSQATEEALECDRAVVLVPVDPSATPATQLECRLDDDPWFPMWEVFGTTTRTVAGVAVEATHARMTVIDDDEHWERTTIDWYLSDSGLPVAVVSESTSSNPTLVGDVRYHEEYQLTLVALDPIR